MRTHILSFESLPSTNTEAARQARQGAREGLCVIAREQTMGRGRDGRIWVSPRDAGLYFSIVLRPDKLELSSWPLLTLMAALAARDALAETCGLEADIKWPNDIMGDGRKLCGILAETIETETGRAAIVGIGINLDNRAFPLDLEGIATSVTSLTGEKPDSPRLLRALVSAIERRYETLQASSGKEETISAWTFHSSYAEGRQVRVTNGAEVIEGVTRGLEPDGALRVETDIGEIRTVHAGDVTSLRESKVQGPKSKV